MQEDTSYFDLIEACSEPGCPVCRASLKLARRYVDSILYEYVNDPGVRDEIRKSRGYCNEHAWWMPDVRGAGLGIAILQRDIVQMVLELTEALPNRRNTRKSAQELLKRLQPTAECPVCAHRRTMEDITLDTLLQHIGDEKLATALASSAGLCLPHFSRALELVDGAEALKRLVALQKNTLARLRDDLAEFIRKNDYRFRDEGFGNEGDSWKRAVGIVSGEHGVR
jgi:Family of unknown function (DUF6062)